MRIIAGLAKGIRLEAPDGRGVRPTEDRVKESLFSTLGDLRGKVVMDLFAGSGALGLEALSRGASRVVFVEQNRRHMDYIRKNHGAVVRAMGEGACGACEFYCMDARKVSSVLACLAGCVDVILADPPYETASGEYGCSQLVADQGVASLLAQGGVLALEHASSHPLEWHPLSCWELLKEKEYGIRAVSFARIFSGEGAE